MSLTPDLLKKIAVNARLHLTEQELQDFLPQLQEILTTFEKLKEVNTENVKPSFQPIEVKDVFREDTPRPCLSSDEVFRNVKNKQGNYFKGPKAV